MNPRNLLLAPLLAAASLTACKKETPPPGPVVLIGLDGASWKVIKPMWEKGELQAMKSLADRGVSGPLKTLPKARSPIIWTTVATGMPLERHGIDDFVADVAGKDPVPLSSNDRKVKAIWNMATESGRRVMTLGWWCSWPAEQVNGLLVSDRWRKAKKVENTTWPTEVAAELDKWRTAADTTYAAYVTGDGGVETSDRVLAWAAVDQMKKQKYDLSMVYLDQVDPASHLYWVFVEPDKYQEQMSDEDKELYGNKVYDAYRAVDRYVGDIVTAAGPDARVMVVSDHGFNAEGKVLVRAETNLAPALEAIGVWKGEGEKVDWSVTKVGVVKSLWVEPRKVVKVNLQGREPNGIVPESQKDKVIKEVKDKLSKFTYKESGKPAFRFPELNPKKDKGDFVVEFIQDDLKDMSEVLLYQGKEVTGALDDISFRSGNHRESPPGILIAAGPGIRAGSTFEAATVHDITPTLLYMMNLPYGEDMSGRPLSALFTEDYAKAHPVTTKPTWETEPRKAVGTPTSSAADGEIVEQLEALGYMEDRRNDKEAKAARAAEKKAKAEGGKKE